VINATGWLSAEQVSQITSDEKLQKALSGGCNTAIIGPEGTHLCPPITEGEGMAIADLDFSLITKRKRMMDSVGHYARPDLLQAHLNAEAFAGFQIAQGGDVIIPPMSDHGLNGLKDYADSQL